MAKETSEVIADKLPTQPLSRKLWLDLVGQRVALMAAVVGLWWVSSLSVPHYIFPRPAHVWQGTRTVNADFIDLAQVLRMPDRKVMTKIYLPTILPYFFSGARLAFGFGWRVSLVAETIGSSSGVGYRLRQAADLIRTDQVFAWTLTLVIMMATIEMGMLKPLENYLFRWKKDAEEQ